VSKQGAKIRKMHELPYSSCIIFVVLFYKQKSGSHSKMTT